MPELWRKESCDKGLPVKEDSTLVNFYDSKERQGPFFVIYYIQSDSES